VSAAVVSVLHGYHSIVDWVGGFDMLRYWGWDYVVSLLLGVIASVILLVLAATSFDAIVRRMGPAWYRLHRSIYLAGLLVVAHAMMTTIHILDLAPLLWTGFLALVFLLLLEMIRLGKAGWRRAPLAATFATLTAAFYWSFFLIGHHRH
jgi:DMSO/TMAO reductase YedYZ heme-binding membrane subunit